MQRSLRLFGHRNWIVVADSAYPAHSGSGIETLVCCAGHIEVLRYLLDSLSREPHVRSTFYFDRELTFLEEGDAPSISSFRTDLRELVGRDYVELPHDEMISKLNEASWTFRVLVLKTSTTIPYTSVFIELQCRYWNEEAERRLRSACSEACAENM